MGQYGRYAVYDPISGRKFVIEPISRFAEKGADWGKTDLSNRPIGGAVHPDDSIITEDNGFKNIVVLGPGESPMSAINSILKDTSRGRAVGSSSGS